MADSGHPLFPDAVHDEHTARRAFEAFVAIYQPTLTTLDAYLCKSIEKTNPVFAEAYKPWRVSLHDLLRGAFLVAKRLPLPNPEAFLDALRTFCFEGTVQFLHDLAFNAKIRLHQDWVQQFRKHIETLLFSFVILHQKNKQPQPSL